MGSVIQENFSKNFKCALKEKGLTQRQFAEIVGLAPASVSCYAQGAAAPSCKRIEEWSELLGVPYLDMMADSKDRQALEIGRRIMADPDLVELLAACKASPGRVKRIVQLLID